MFQEKLLHLSVGFISRNGCSINPGNSFGEITFYCDRDFMIYSLIMEKAEFTKSPINSYNTMWRHTQRTVNFITIFFRKYQEN